MPPLQRGWELPKPGGGLQACMVTTAERADEAIEAAPADFVVIDLRLSDGSGLHLLSTLPAARADAGAIALSACGNIQFAVAASRAGARNRLPKPAFVDEVADALLAAPCATSPPSMDAIDPAEFRWPNIPHVFYRGGVDSSETGRRLNLHRRTLQRMFARRPAGQERN